MKIFTGWFAPKPLTMTERIKQGDDVSVEEICDHIRKILPKDEQTKFFNKIQLSVYPIIVQKLLEFKDKGEISEEKFFELLRENTQDINELREE